MRRKTSLSACLILLATPLAASADLVIRNARLIDGTGAAPVENATIVVTGDRIVSVDGSGASASATVIDAEDKTVMPGLAELHVHSTVEFWTQGGSGGYPSPDVAITSDADMAEFRAERLADRLLSFLDAGVTTIMDPGGFMPFVVEIRDQVAAGELLGPRMVVSGRLFTAPRGHPAATVCNGNEWCIEHLTCNTNDPETARQCARDIVAGGVDGLKLVYDGGFGAERMTQEVLQAVVDEGHKLGVPVVAHAFSVADVAAVVKAGVDGLVHAATDRGGRLLTASGEHLPELLSQRNISMTTTVRFADPGPESTAQLDVARRSRNIERDIGPSLQAFATAGVPLLFGTDFEGIGTPADPRPLIEAEMRVLLASGFSRMEVIEMMTGQAAKHPFTPDDVGTAVPGKLADLIILDGDPLADLTAATRPTVVIKGGEIVIDKRPPADEPLGRGVVGLIMLLDEDALAKPEPTPEGTLR